MEDESVAPVPNPRVQQRLFQLTRPKATEEVKKEAQNALLTEIEKDGRLVTARLTIQRCYLTTISYWLILALRS